MARKINEQVIKPKLENTIDQELRLSLTIQNNNLRKARLDKKLLQRDIAKIIGISSMYYSQIETCHTYPSQDKQEKIGEILNKPISYLFPRWLEAFTAKWKRAEKKRIILASQLKCIPLDSPEVLMLKNPNNLENDISKIILKDKVKSFIQEANLTLREQKILEMRFGLKDGIAHTLEEVGEEFGVTRERVGQIEIKALEKLHFYLEDKKIKIEMLY